MVKSAVQESVVLVMARNDIDAKVMISTLKRGGFEVVPCSEPREAIELCRKDDSRINVAIVDPQTPDLSLAEFLSAIPPRIRVLLVAEPAVLDNAAACVGAKNIRLKLQKPIRRATLLGSVLKLASEPLYRTA
jgi:DNA-binding NtrC family response regulator